MQRLTKWLKASARELINPDRDKYLDAWTGALSHEVSRQKALLELAATADALGIPIEDVPEVARRVYLGFLEKAWSDGMVQPKELAALDLVARVMRLTEAERREIDLRAGTPMFRAALTAAIADGVLTDEEVKALESIAAALRRSVRELLLEVFHRDGVSALTKLFLAVSSGQFRLEEHWERLNRTIRRLGISTEEFKSLICPAATHYAEMLLADVKADGRMSVDEERSLRFAMNHLGLSSEVRAYLERELGRLKVLAEAGEGRLPSVRVTEIGMKAGEIVHYLGAATYSRVRFRRGAPVDDHHAGRLIVTDYRMIFSSPTLQLEVSHRRVIQVQVHPNGMAVESSAKGSGFYALDDSELLYLIYAVAVGRANQTIVDRSRTQATRHIPRDVRQRVWQQYGGRCADCGSDQYIEFDHIVPHSRGGTNTEANVQLLCRGCNSSKSDDI